MITWLTISPLKGQGQCGGIDHHHQKGSAESDALTGVDWQSDFIKDELREMRMKNNLVTIKSLLRRIILFACNYRYLIV